MVITPGERRKSSLDLTYFKAVDGVPNTSHVIYVMSGLQVQN